MASKSIQPRFLILFLLVSLHIVSSFGAPSLSSNDANILLKFKESLKDDNESLKSWISSTSPCVGGKNDWVGIICSRGGNIWGLRLENMGLKGSIDVDSLTQLPRLRSISVTNNSFGGQLPDFRKLRPLKSIYLSHNNFEGSIAPNAFEGMRRLRKIHLEYNQFSGEFPTSLTSLTKLVELSLESNHFQGALPNLKLSTSLNVFNVSNNQFQGSIPTSLAKFDVTAFTGNNELCGTPLVQPCTQTSSIQNVIPPPPKQPSTSEKPIPIIAIVIGVITAIILAIIVIMMVLHTRGDKDNNNVVVNNPSKMSKAPPKKVVARDIDDHGDEASHRSTTSVVGGRNKGENGKLTFIKEDIEKFDLPDLLKASAEILGSGCFGSSYKATFSNGNGNEIAVVVKRFKRMNNVGRDEFREHMTRLGRLSHPNLLTLVAYYYRKEEKLFITLPMQNGSLAALLHGQARGKSTLDWPTRLKVIKGIVRGLSYLYKELPILVAPHGHLKSSNVLLDKSFEPVLSDYGLIPLINQENVQEMMVAYKSPEFINNGRVTKKTDVWALGILILETLTGKFPSSNLQQGSEVDMSSWVTCVVDGGFDKNMGQTTKNSEREMGKLLQIGIQCCESNVEKRLDIKEAFERIEEVRERDDDNDDDFYSTSASIIEADHIRSSRGIILSDDFTLTIN